MDDERTTSNAVSAPRTFTEGHGIDHVPERQRHGRARDQFSTRFSPVIYLAPVVLAGAGIPLGLGLTGSITAILTGNVLGSLATAGCAVMGPRLGMPQVTMGRSAFGRRGNYVLAALGVLLFVGYFSVGTVLGARSLTDLLGVPYTVTVTVVSVASVLVAIFGYNLVKLLSRWLTWLSFAVFGTVSVLLVLHGLGPTATASVSGADYVLAWLIELSIVFSYTGSWAIYASDFSRYLPARIRLPRMFAYAFAGTFASTSWMMVLGAALFTLTPGVDDVLAGFRLVLPGGVLQIVLVTFIVGALAHNAVNLYSGALAGLTCDLPVGRSISVVVLGVLGGVIAAAFGGSGFLANLELFLLWCPTSSCRGSVSC